jgi:hypothetical protein
VLVIFYTRIQEDKKIKFLKCCFIRTYARGTNNMGLTLFSGDIYVIFASPVGDGAALAELVFAPYYAND